MDPSVFKGMKLCISTPMYRSEICDAYHDSRRQLDRYLYSAGIGYYPHKCRDTYLPRARNVLADAFLNTDATHQLLLDSDMGFDAEDIMRMLYHVAANPKIWVLAGAYPTRQLNWQRVKEAVLHNPNITPEQLEHVAPGEWTFGGLPEGSYDLGSPILMPKNKPHVATGLMLLAREAYEKLKPVSPLYTEYRNDKQIHRFFHCDIEEDTNAWLGEDVWFCRQLNKAGVNLYLAAWVKSEHWGPFCFKGDLAKVIDAGVEFGNV